MRISTHANAFHTAQPNQPHRPPLQGGLMSTTTKKEVASFYAQGGARKKDMKGPAILFETQLGMVARGADVSWLSEFPGEEEILFSPLAMIEVRGSRVEGALQV